GLDNVLNSKQLDDLFKNNQIVLPKKRNYYIQTNYSHYVHAHHAEAIDKARELMSPTYQISYDKIMKRTDQHLFNMLIMTRQQLDEYADWMFDILFKLEKEIDTSTYDQYEKRVFGFVGERLLDIFLDANNKKYVEVPFVFEEKQNWFKKGGNFLIRTIAGGKDDK
ncbi:DUF4422 domain-containing protein, partial [Oenococcus oeni]